MHSKADFMQQVGHGDAYTVYLSALKEVMKHIYVR